MGNLLIGSHNHVMMYHSVSVMDVVIVLVLVVLVVVVVHGG